MVSEATHLNQVANLLSDILTHLEAYITLQGHFLFLTKKFDLKNLISQHDGKQSRGL